MFCSIRSMDPFLTPNRSLVTSPLISSDEERPDDPTRPTPAARPDAPKQAPRPPKLFIATSALHRRPLHLLTSGCVRLSESSLRLLVTVGRGQDLPNVGILALDRSSLLLSAPRGHSRRLDHRRPGPLVPRDALARHRPDSRRTRPRAGRRRQPAEHLLRRLRQRRRLAIHRLRRQLGAAVRRPVDRLDRRDRRRAVEPERHLRRHRRRHHPPRSGDRRRHVQVHRRRAHVAASRAARQPDDRGDRRGSDATPIGCSSPCSAIRTAPTPSAACSARPTAAAPSRRCSSRTTTPAPTKSCIDPSNPNILYATLWSQQQSFIEGQGFGNAGMGIFKSTDGGTTWTQLVRRTAGHPAGEHRDRAERSEHPLRRPSRPDRGRSASTSPPTAARIGSRRFAARARRPD